MNIIVENIITKNVVSVEDRKLISRCLQIRKMCLEDTIRKPNDNLIPLKPQLYRVVKFSRSTENELAKLTTNIISLQDKVFLIYKEKKYYDSEKGTVSFEFCIENNSADLDSILTDGSFDVYKSFSFSLEDLSKL